MGKENTTSPRGGRFVKGNSAFKPPRVGGMDCVQAGIGSMDRASTSKRGGLELGIPIFPPDEAAASSDEARCEDIVNDNQNLASTTMATGKRKVRETGIKKETGRSAPQAGTD